MEQNREVFAVPDPADSLPSRGCHRLIRDGARLVWSVDDFLEIEPVPSRSVIASDAPFAV
jgi:DNA processing protein